jgi:hypothetical protein
MMLASPAAPPPLASNPAANAAVTAVGRMACPFVPRSFLRCLPLPRPALPAVEVLSVMNLSLSV